QDLVFRDLKSVRWCFTDQTALAEAELEYTETEDPAIYVAMRTSDRRKLDEAFDPRERPDELRDSEAFLVIWTTTPWTIPSNLAIAVHPEEDYLLVAAGGRLYVVAEKMSAAVAQALGWSGWKPVGRAKGSALVGLRYTHPLSSVMRGELTPEEEARSFRVVAGDYVTMVAGTGLVHTAPGAGEDDFQTGKRENLPILSPVDAGGRLTPSRAT